MLLHHTFQLTLSGFQINELKLNAEMKVTGNRASLFDSQFQLLTYWSVEQN